MSAHGAGADGGEAAIQPDGNGGGPGPSGAGVSRLRAVLPYCAGLLVTTVYGLFTYAVMQIDVGSWLPGAMSVTFLFTLPVAIGACAVALAPPDRRDSIRYILIVPWVASLLVAAIPLLFAWEAIICVVMALPLFLPLTTLGAGLAFMVLRTAGQRWSTQNPLLLMALLPYVIAPMEAQIAAPDSQHVVQNSIVIDAAPDVVWRQIVSVPTIGREEQTFSVLHLIGLPRPLAATLSGAGIGAIRHASFEGGLVFVETVTDWQENRILAFSIVRDQQSKPPPPLEAIGGPFFDMLDGRYEIEPIGDRRVILHLSSTHRLTTRFNWYAGMWTEPIMSELQRYILAIVKARSQVAALSGR
jgi:hypothetical protein